MSRSLFSNLGHDFTVARVTPSDAQRRTDLWSDLRRLVLGCEQMYPRIGDWIDDTVHGGLSSLRRSAFVGYHNGQPVVSSVAKHGDTAKICHLWVREDLRGSNIGEFFFALMAMEVGSRCKRVHFTLPEGLWEQQKFFFSSFGFDIAQKSNKQYRLFENELYCSASFQEVWRSIIRKLPKLRASLSIGPCSNDSELLLSIKPRFVEAILTGRKTVEIRRSFSRRWLGRRAAFYATAPSSSIVGEAIVERIVESDPESIWREFGAAIGSSRHEFYLYAKGMQKVYAIVLSSPRRYVNPLSLQMARQLVDKKLRPPQSYVALKPDSQWASAVPIASLLQATGIGIFTA